LSGVVVSVVRQTGFLFLSFRPAVFFAFVFFLLCSCLLAIVDVFVSSDSSPLLRFFLFGLIWVVQLLFVSLWLPYDSLSLNVRNACIGFLTLAHAAVTLGLQEGGGRSAYLFTLLAFFAALLMLLLFREKLASRVPWLRVTRRSDMRAEEAAVVQQKEHVEAQLESLFGFLPTAVAAQPQRLKDREQRRKSAHMPRAVDTVYPLADAESDPIVGDAGLEREEVKRTTRDGQQRQIAMGSSKTALPHAVSTILPSLATAKGALPPFPVAHATVAGAASGSTADTTPNQRSSSSSSSSSSSGGGSVRNKKHHSSVLVYSPERARAAAGSAKGSGNGPASPSQRASIHCLGSPSAAGSALRGRHSHMTLSPLSVGTPAAAPLSPFDFPQPTASPSVVSMRGVSLGMGTGPLFTRRALSLLHLPISEHQVAEAAAVEAAAAAAATTSSPAVAVATADPAGASPLLPTLPAVMETSRGPGLPLPLSSLPILQPQQGSQQHPPPSCTTQL